MSINRLQAALCAVTNEVTVAAAQINFDFSLIKTEAPKEYRSVGQCLSDKRKNEAENGQIHVTARRLGALFEGTCPPTPNLMKAYGTRVSEIARSVKLQATSGGETAVFGEYVGADGTSIWAAATSVTSSTSAIQIQLLACMLARLFDAPEAISIWVEIVKDRRSEIVTGFEKNEETPFSFLTAACQAEISRAQLAEWDASARAWLRTADSTKIKEQKQLMLILDNLGLPVNEDGRVYSSVISTWRSSLATMEKLVRGIPQAVESGEAILGLASWHLYPDMVVLASSNPDLRMNDEVVAPGGVLTVGLKNHTAKVPNEKSMPGIFWSLSLAHLRYYGQPVLITRHMNSNTSRVDFNQFSQAVFGCLLSKWEVPRSQIAIAAEVISAIADALGKEEGSSTVQQKMRPMPRWFDMMAEAAGKLQAGNEQEKDQITRLLNLGRRRSHAFLSSESKSEPEAHFADVRYLKINDPPFFGLQEQQFFLRCLRSDGESIEYLRRVAKSITGAAISDLIIRYKWRSSYAFATAKENQNPFGINHERWFPVDSTSSKIGSVRTRLQYAPPTNTLDQHAPHRGRIIETYRRYNFLFGDTESAALFIDESKESLYGTFMQQVPLEDILWCAKRNMLSLYDSSASLAWAIEAATTDYLQVLDAVKQVYDELPGATLDVRVLDSPIMATQWVSHLLRDEQNMGCNRETALACITYFETGKSDVSPDYLHDIFAMSSEDSIYISKQLLCDPWELQPGYKFSRVLGNFGRSGVTMLIPPAIPMIRQPDPGAWKVINHAAFNNLEEDHFAKTSLHLSFTEYYRSVDLKLRGEQDIRVAVLESVLSVHDSGKWVADVDILASLGSLEVQRVSHDFRCQALHEEEAVSLESWDEILDLPSGTSVVRAKGNSLARLAITAVLTQLHKSKKFSQKIKVCPPKDRICILCYMKTQKTKDNVLVY
ncbi:hypothetical protein GQ44DRAFT_695516 [Phaeosphaeriaceae sp. PMI808]|nr:hypothetical protein GQ44DRAFT_695516 [Phaeosphaeriaceae sp. PMI808]